MSKRMSLTGSFFSLVILLPVFAAGGFAGNQPPANNDLANAQVLSGASGQSVAVNTTWATKEPGEPEHAKDPGARSAWYKYTAGSNGVVSVNTGASDYDTLLAVYQGTSMSNLLLVAQNDDVYGPAASCLCSLVTFGALEGTTYYIAVDGKSGHYGNAVLTYSLANVAANDNFANAFQLPNASGRMYTTTNLAATKEPGEPSHAGDNGGRSVWFKWIAPAGTPKVYDFSIDARSVGGLAVPLFAIYTGSGVANLTQVGRGEKALHSRIVFKAVPGTTYYIAVDGSNVGGNVHQITAVLDYRPFRSDKIADFDHDGRSDFAVYRWFGRWFWQRSGVYHYPDDLHALDWGLAGDTPLLSDWNGDGSQDFMLFRPSNGTWWMKSNGTSQVSAFQWGVTGDIPLVYESHVAQAGTNTSSPVVFRPSNGVWYKYTGLTSEFTQWGVSGDTPVTADFTGDGVDDITVFRPSTGVWYIRDGFFGGLYRAVQFGQTGDVPVVADYDGDFIADIAVYRRMSGTWYVLRSSDGGFQAVQWGTATDTPQPLDFDGDGKAEYAVFRTGRWFMLLTTTGEYRLEFFGITDDVPVTVPRY